MLRENIDKEILNAMHEKDRIKLRTLRLLKTAFMEHRTAKNSKPLDDAVETTIIRKMIAEREDAAIQYDGANRPDLAVKEREEITVLNTYLPPEVPLTDIEAYANEVVIERGMQNMGKYVKMLKERFPTANGEVIAATVKSLVM